MTRESKKIYVFADWEWLAGSVLVGTLNVDSVRGEEIFSFEYDRDWLKRRACPFLDPDLQLFDGRQFVPDSKKCFGLFADSSPDRWGRQLMKRRETLLSGAAGRNPKILRESDFLLGVYDLSRSGALRFKTDLMGNFLASDTRYPTPPWAKLRDLENAAFHIEKDESSEDDQWIEMLYAPGSSLGGARPKANVIDPDGALWIAKFPSANDACDIGAWEMVVHELAKKCGLDVPEAKTLKLSKRGHTFLVRRFDRRGDYRIHVCSAMTMLGLVDGTNASDGNSYLQLAEVIRERSITPHRDLRELWKRIAFNVLVSNTDDHLRNHAFVMTEKGYHLSPLFDVNPNPQGKGLCLNINETDNALDLSLLREVAGLFDIESGESKRILDELKETVSTWPAEAKRVGISKSGCDWMENAFSRDFRTFKHS